MTALAYTLIYLAAVAPGIPIGLRLFGARHAAGWVSGALIGYGLTQLALWAVIVLDLASTVAFVAAWLLLTIATTAGSQ